LKDPFLWPFIWKANPYIANPDLIYPGNNLAIPSLAPIERALQLAERWDSATPSSGGIAGTGLRPARPRGNGSGEPLGPARGAAHPDHR
jgi:hypothetical protein